jgi:hypothetical protein
MGHHVTAHGFRATFRTWAQEHTGYVEEVPELALAHVNSDRTRTAYARGELIEKRGQLMEDWEHFILYGRNKRGKKSDPLRRMEVMDLAKIRLPLDRSRVACAFVVQLYSNDSCSPSILVALALTACSARANVSTPFSRCPSLWAVSPQ